MIRTWKTELLVLFAGLFVISGSVGLTWAYFTQNSLLKNKLNAGSNEIEIVENYEPPERLEVGETIFRKRMEVKNTGRIPCYIRVFADFSDYEIRDRSEFSPDGSVFYPAAEYQEYLPEPWQFISEEEDELLGGYYYYGDILEVGEKTVPLLEKVKCSFERADQIHPFDILISAESVQIRDRFGETFMGEAAHLQAWREFLERR